MLSLMRKHATSWLIKIILGAIVIVFVLWGVGSWTSQRSGRVATVNGEMITADEYRVAYKRLIEQVRQSFGNNLNDELIKTLQLDKQALNQLIDKILMRQAALNLICGFPTKSCLDPLEVSARFKPPVFSTLAVTRVCWIATIGLPMTLNSAKEMHY